MNKLERVRERVIIKKDLRKKKIKGLLVCIPAMNVWKCNVLLKIFLTFVSVHNTEILMVMF